MPIEATRRINSSYSNTNKAESTQRNRSDKNDNSKKIDLDKFERNTQKDEIKYEKRLGRKNKKSEDTPAPTTPTPAPQPPVSTQPPVSIEPTPPVTPTAPEKDQGTYAERYVALYEKNSGKTLSKDERAAKVAAVAEFYSDPSRSNRLETLVNGLSAAA